MQRRTLIQLLGTGTVLGGAAGVASGGDRGARAGDDDERGPPEETPANDEAADEATDGPPAHQCDDGLVTVPGDESVAATVERITSAIEESPASLLATVDHAENAASVDRELRPTTLLLFGNPDVGTPLMQASRSVAIDLPQKLLVWEDENCDVHVTYNDPQYLAQRHGIEDQCERLEAIADLLEQLATGDECADGD